MLTFSNAKQTQVKFFLQETAFIYWYESVKYQLSIVLDYFMHLLYLLIK